MPPKQCIVVTKWRRRNVCTIREKNLAPAEDAPVHDVLVAMLLLVPTGVY